MTPIIDSLRTLMLNQPAGGTLVPALCWSTGIIVAAFVIAVQLYKRKLT